MGNKTPSSSNSNHGLKNINTTTIYKQEEPQSWCCCCKKQVSYRIPALVYLSDDQTFLAFAEKRKTLSDTSAEVLVMRRGTWNDGKKIKEVEVQNNFLTNSLFQMLYTTWHEHSHDAFYFSGSVDIRCSLQHVYQTTAA